MLECLINTNTRQLTVTYSRKRWSILTKAIHVDYKQSWRTCKWPLLWVCMWINTHTEVLRQLVVSLHFALATVSHTSKVSIHHRGLWVGILHSDIILCSLPFSLSLSLPPSLSPLPFTVCGLLDWADPTALLVRRLGKWWNSIITICIPGPSRAKGRVQTTVYTHPVSVSPYWAQPQTADAFWNFIYKPLHNVILCYIHTCTCK